MLKLRNLMMFAAILGASLTANVFAHEEATKEAVVNEPAAVVQPADVTATAEAKEVKKEGKKAPCKKAKKAKVTKVEPAKAEIVKDEAPAVDAAVAPEAPVKK